jgi:hypothetical protein
MAYTYSKIATYTVGSGGVSTVSFLNIPQNYTDLVVMTSARTDSSGTADDVLVCYFNSNQTGYSGKRSFGTGTGTGSDSLSNSNGGASGSRILVGAISSTGGTSNTFGNASLYISNYTKGTYKSTSGEGVQSNNTTGSYQMMSNNLWANTEPITSITLGGYWSNTFVQHSTFHLYGIKAEV